jgi:predicted deacylase
MLSIDADYIFDLHCDDHSAAHIYAVESQTAAAKVLCQQLGFGYLFLEGLEGIVAFDGTHLQTWYQLQQAFPRHPISMPALAVTVEYRGQYEVSDELASKDAAKLLGYLASQRVLDPAAGDAGFEHTSADRTNIDNTNNTRDPVISPLSAVDTVFAEYAGLLVYQCQLNTKVSKGQVIAEIIQLEALPPKNRQPVVAKTEGYLMAMTHRRLTRPGDLIGKIAGEVALDYRQAGNLLQL